MKLLFFLSFCLLPVPALFSQTPVMDWVGQLSGLGSQSGLNVTVDSLGQVYSIGQFGGTADLDPGPMNWSVTAVGGQDIFINKLSSSGNLIWTKVIGGLNNERPFNVQVDMLGNVFVAGSFEQTIDVDPGVNVFNLTSAGGADFFVLKLDGNGNFLWARQFGGSGNESNVSMMIDPSGFLLLSGIFHGTADMDPGPGILNITSTGFSDVFILKLDFTGNMVWVKSIGGQGGDDVRSMALDPSKNVYLAGHFFESADFDPGPDTAFLWCCYNQSDIYFSKLDSNGEFILVRHLKGNLNASQFVTQLKVSNAYTLILSGWFSDTLDMDPGPAFFPIISPIVGNVMTNDSYIAQYDTAGQLLWVKQFSGSDHVYVECMALDTMGNIYVGGRFYDTVDFDPGPSPYNLVSTDYSDLFMAKLNPSGLFQWAIGMGGIGGDHCFGIFSDQVGNVYSTGSFFSTVDFDPGPDTALLISPGNNFDAFIYKLTQCAVDVQTTQIGNTMSAVANGSSYQWVDCNNNYSPIPGATAQSFSPPANGNYAVIIQTGKCRDTSQCIAITEIGVGLEDLTREHLPILFPNPANEQVNVLLGKEAQIQLLSCVGAILFSDRFQAGQHILHVKDLPVGVYYVRIDSGHQRFVKKLVLSW